jgi:hypothetical protein
MLHPESPTPLSILHPPAIIAENNVAAIIFLLAFDEAIYHSKLESSNASNMPTKDMKETTSRDFKGGLVGEQFWCCSRCKSGGKNAILGTPCQTW